MTALTVAAQIPLGGHAIPNPRPYLLQERTPDGKVIRRFEHATATCAITELELLHSCQPWHYADGARILVVVAPSGAVIAHTGTPADLLPEWSVTETTLLSVGSAWVVGPR